MLNIRLQQLLLVQNLKSNNEFRFLFASEVYMAEFAPPQRFPNLEIIYRPVLWLKLLALQYVHLVMCDALSLMIFCRLLRIVIGINHLYLLMLYWRLL